MVRCSLNLLLPPKAYRFLQRTMRVGVETWASHPALLGQRCSDSHSWFPRLCFDLFFCLLIYSFVCFVRRRRPEALRASAADAAAQEAAVLERALALSREAHAGAHAGGAAAGGGEGEDLDEAMRRSMLATTEDDQLLFVVVNSQLPTLLSMFDGYPLGLLRHALVRTATRDGVGGAPRVDPDLAVSWLVESGAEYLSSHLELYRQ